MHSMPPSNAASLGLLLLLGACSTSPLPSSANDEDTESSTDNGSESSTENGDTTEATEDTDEPACDWDAYQACLERNGVSWNECLNACAEPPLLTCADELCTVECDVAHQLVAWECEDTYCPGERDPCEHDCKVAALACAEDGCEPHECSYDLYLCFGECSLCPGVVFDYAWADSCELLFPGPLAAPSGPLTRIIVGDLDEYVHEAWEASCGDVDVFAIMGSDNDRITLCTEACQAFAEVSVLRVDVGALNCA